MDIKFKILGRTRLRIGDRFDEWGYRKLRGMLAALLLQPGQAMPIDDLIEWVWPDGKSPGTPHNTLMSYASRIRKYLRQMAEPAELAMADGTYRIEVNRAEIDFVQFKNLVEKARTASRLNAHERAIPMIKSALDLWNDPPLADLDGSRAINWRRTARQNYLLPAHGDLFRELVAIHEFTEVLQRVGELPVEDQGVFIRPRIESLYALGREEEATALFQAERRRLLADDQRAEADNLTRFHEQVITEDRGRPEPVIPVVAPVGSPVEAPNLLPHDVRDFMGREDLLNELNKETSTPTGEPHSTVVVLTGPPGVGKTSLALRWAHTVSNRFPDGVLYADLNGFADGPKVAASEAVEKFLGALGFPTERIATDTGKAAKLSGLLANRQTLVVLDNVADSNHVQSLLSCLSSCPVVITSRRRLSKLGQQWVPNLSLSPLPPRECRAWLAKHIGARAMHEPRAVDEFVALCAGNPLALRVVANHVHARPGVRLSEFVNELRDPEALLSLGDDGDSHDGSVRTVFSWSYLTLDQEEQRTFRLLGLHPGHDFSLDAATALVGRTKNHTKRLLDKLVNFHLLTQPESRERYRFHDLIKKYAAELARQDDEPEKRAAEHRMLNFYLYTVNNADTQIFASRTHIPMPETAGDVTAISFSNEAAAISWCMREHGNLNQIIEYCAHHGFQEQALNLCQAFGETLQMLGHYDNVLAMLALSIEIARSMANVSAEADAISNRGHILTCLGRYTSAEADLRTAKEMYDRIDYRFGGAFAMYQLARLQIERGNFKQGIDLHLQALDELRNYGAEDPGIEVIALCHLGEAYRKAGNLSNAISFAHEGLLLANQRKDQRGQGRCLTELSAIHHAEGNLPVAKGHAHRALPIQETLSDFAMMGNTYQILASKVSGPLLSKSPNSTLRSALPL
jgi:tetratricopeptide (TPR) repeat protein